MPHGITSNYRRNLSLLFFVAVLAFVFAFAQAGTPNSAMILNENIKPLLDSYKNKDEDFQTFLLEQKNIEIPKDIDIGKNFKKLPLRPNEDLLESFQSESGDLGPPDWRLFWIDKKRFGGMVYFAGSGMCQNWTMVQSDGHDLIPAYPPDIFEPYVCGNDGGGFGHGTFIAEIGDQIVAIKDGVEQTDSGALQFHVYLQVWDGSSWGAPADTTIDVNFPH